MNLRQGGSFGAYAYVGRTQEPSSFANCRSWTHPGVLGSTTVRGCMVSNGRITHRWGTLELILVAPHSRGLVAWTSILVGPKLLFGWWFQTWMLFSISYIIYGMSSFPLTNSYFSRWLLHHQAVMIFQWTVQPVFPEGIAMATGTSVLFTGETLVGGLLYKTTWSFSILYYGDIMGISNNQHSPTLLIYQWPGWWFGTMEWIMTFQKQLGTINHPNRRTPSFFRGVGRNRQPDGDMYLRNLTHYCPLMDLTIHFHFW